MYLAETHLHRQSEMDLKFPKVSRDPKKPNVWGKTFFQSECEV